MGNHFKASPWHCCSWEMRVVPPLLVLDPPHPFSHGLLCWFNGGISTSLGCKPANGGEGLFGCHMKPPLFSGHPTQESHPSFLSKCRRWTGAEQLSLLSQSEGDCTDQTASPHSGGGVGAARSGSNSQVSCKLSRLFLVFICCLYRISRAGRDLANVGGHFSAPP